MNANVKVKPLEWRELTFPREDGPPEGSGDWEGYGITGVYSVYIFDDHYEATRPDGEYVEHFIGDPDEAKAACDDHYATSILSAIEVSE